jgi:hypothetical protein
MRLQTTFPKLCQEKFTAWTLRTKIQRTSVIKSFLFLLPGKCIDKRIEVREFNQRQRSKGSDQQAHPPADSVAFAADASVVFFGAASLISITFKKKNKEIIFDTTTTTKRKRRQRAYSLNFVVEGLIQRLAVLWLVFGRAL